MTPSLVLHNPNRATALNVHFQVSVPEAVQDLTLALSFSHAMPLSSLLYSQPSIVPNTDTPHLYFTYSPCFSILPPLFSAPSNLIFLVNTNFPLFQLSHRPRSAKKNRRQADLREPVGSPAAPSPRKRTFTSLPFNPFARITCGSPGTKSIPWSPHATSSSPSATSNTTPLIGFSVASWTDSPSESTLTDSPSAWTGGKVMYLNGSGLYKVTFVCVVVNQ